MPTAAEVIAAVNELPAEERAAFTTLFLNDQGDVVKGARSKAFAAGKAEGAKGGTEAAQKLADAEQRATDLQAKLDELSASKPDVKALEETLNARWQKKLDAEKQRADTAVTTLRQREVALARAEFLAALTAPAEDGTRVDPEWAADVADARWGSRLAAREEGGVRVLQLDGDMEYDAPDTKAALRQLAADARRTVPARYVLTNADTGAGVTSGGVVGGAGGYDPVKAGLAAAEAQKANAATNELAFR